MRKNVKNFSQEELVKENHEFLFYSAGLGKRILAFLADFFINFIVAVFFFEIVYFPIAKPCIKYEETVKEITENHQQRVDVMYDLGFLSYKDEATKYNVQANIDYTGDKFLEFYVFKEEKTLNFIDPIIYYWEFVATVPKDRKQIFANYIGTGSKSPYFEEYTGKTDFPILKDEYKKMFKPYFDKNDTISDSVKEEIIKFKSASFDYNFRPIIEDFSKTNKTYIYYTNLINDKYTYLDNWYQIVVTPAFLTAFLIFNVIIPLINKKGKTIGKMILKLERVDCYKFKNLNIKNKIIISLLELLEQCSMLVFLPFISVGFNNVFQLTVLFALSFVALVYCVISMVILILNNYGKSIKEILSRTVVCESELIDEYVKEVENDQK